MGLQKGASATNSAIKVGNQCLLSFAGNHYMVRILDVGTTTVSLTFPGEDYPIEGLEVDLEFHDEEGIDRFSTTVLEGPKGSSRGIVVQRPREAVRNQHRRNWRIDTDLTAQVKEQVHIRRYDAKVLNLSQGGASLLTEGPFDLDTTIEVSLSLPGRAAYTILGKVVHVNSTHHDLRPNQRVLGVRFVGLDPQVANSITDYIWRKLEEESRRRQ